MEDKNMDVKSLTALVFFAILIEGMVEYIKLGIQKNICIEIISSMVLGLIVAFGFHLDFFAAVGITTDVPYISTVLTGIIVSRGSNYAFDLIGKFTEVEAEVIRLTEEQKENMAIVRPDEEFNADMVTHEKTEGEG
jgi:hypothetical protein